MGAKQSNRRKCGDGLAAAFGLGQGMLALAAFCAVTSPIASFAQTAEQALNVEVVTVQVAQLEEVINLTGTLEASETLVVAFRSAGRVSEVLTDVGQRVSAGDVLAKVDPTQAAAAERAAMAQLAAAEASLTQAELARSRARGLLERGASTRAEVDAAEEAWVAAVSARDQAAAQRDKAHEAFLDTKIEAPVSGVITERNVEPGQILGEAQAAFTIAPDKGREAVFYAPNAQGLADQLGRAVEIRGLDNPDLVYPAEISEVAPLADVATGTVRVKARIEGDAPALGLGIPVTSSLTILGGDVMVLPWTALALDLNQAAVWRLDEAGRVSLVPVTLLRHTSETVELALPKSEQDAAALKIGDFVVATGSHLLYPGRLVRALGEAE